MSLNLSQVWTELEKTARSQGVLSIGASTLEDEHVGLFSQWLEEGHHASMSYLATNRTVREHPSSRFPWATSIIVITVPYSSERPLPDGSLASGIARYAQGDDYHVVLDEILRSLEQVIHATLPHAMTRRYVDTGPLSDRTYGAQSGLGWIGRNGMLIDPEHGSYFFIGTLLTSLENDMSVAEVADRCGNCTRCVDACPTVAILPNRTVDSHRCISHATIEQRGAIPDDIAASLGENLFGCDICQEVCPWNIAPPAPHPSFRMREEYRATPISDLLRITQTDFSQLFRGSAVKRAKRAGMIRNALLVGEVSAQAVEVFEEDVDEGIRSAGEWRRARI